jgi:hypothetical protein
MPAHNRRELFAITTVTCLSLADIENTVIVSLGIFAKDTQIWQLLI